MSENDDTSVEGSELSDHQVKELTRQLAEAESAIEALVAGQVDAMLDSATVTPVLLQQFQEALRESEARYHRLVSRMAALIFELAPDGTTFFVNEAAIKMFGYQPDELQGHNWWNILLSAEQRQQLTDLYGQFQTGDVTNYELVLTARDGSLVTLALNSANYYQTDGTLHRVVGFGLDITERKQIEAELIEVQRRLLDSRETERLQLAQELHDGPVQNLYGVAFQLSVLKEALSTELDQAKLTVTQQLIQQVIQTLRTTFTELRPPTLAPFGLEKAIRSHAEGFQATYPALKIKLDLMPDGRTLPERVRLALFRIYQAALNNVVRHANAQQVVIRLKLDTENVVLEVQDNGQGFAVPKRWIKLARQGHLGLVGMVDRAEAIRGQLEIVSAPEAGTLVRIIAPQAGDESSSSF